MKNGNGFIAILRFLMYNGVEVKKMLLTEYDERRTMEMFKEEGRAEGHLAALLEAVRNLKAQLGYPMNRPRGR